MSAPWVVTQKINEQKLGLHNDARKEALSGPHLSVHSNSSGSAAAYPTHPALCATLCSPAPSRLLCDSRVKKGCPSPPLLSLRMVSEPVDSRVDRDKKLRPLVVAFSIESGRYGFSSGSTPLPAVPTAHARSHQMACRNFSLLVAIKERKKRNLY